MSPDLKCGYALEYPPITVPWGLSRRDLVRALAAHGLRKLDDHSFVLSCKSLSGLSHHIQFRFDAAYGPNRYMLALYQLPNHSINESYNTYQRHLELIFGQPSSSENTENGFPHHTWQIGDFTIDHSVYERFTLCESVSIQPPRCMPSLPARWWQASVYWFTLEKFMIPRLMLFLLVLVLLAILLLSRSS